MRTRSEPETYSEILDYARDVLEDVSQEAYGDIETSKKQLREIVAYLDEVEGRADELAEANNALSNALDQAGSELNEYEELVDEAYNKITEVDPDHPNRSANVNINVNDIDEPKVSKRNLLGYLFAGAALGIGGGYILTQEDESDQDSDSGDVNVNNGRGNINTGESADNADDSTTSEDPPTGTPGAGAGMYDSGYSFTMTDDQLRGLAASLDNGFVTCEDTNKFVELVNDLDELGMSDLDDLGYEVEGWINDDGFDPDQENRFVYREESPALQTSVEGEGEEFAEIELTEDIFTAVEQYYNGTGDC